VRDLVTHYRDVTARHEAGHVAATVMLRRRLPHSVTADRPADHVAGQMLPDLTDDGVNPSSAEDFMCMVLAGPLTESLDCPTPEWPLDRDDPVPDNRALAVLAAYAGLDEDGWMAVVERTRALTAEHDFKRLVRLIGRALELKDELDQGDLRRLIPARLAEKYGIEREEALCST
jgi:hypothetical protein